jgi:hypothetical protein
MQSQMQLQERELGKGFIASWAAIITKSRHEWQCEWQHPEHELQRLRRRDPKCKPSGFAQQHRLCHGIAVKTHGLNMEPQTAGERDPVTDMN